MNARHRARRPGGPGRRGRRVLAAVGATVTVGVTAAGLTLGTGPSPATSKDCPIGGRGLEVVAAPEIAPVIAELVTLLGHDAADGDPPACAGPVVRAERPARTARALATDAADRPDVWVPDSSVWAEWPPGPGGRVPPRNPSVASSPFVLAVAGRRAPGADSSAEPVTVEDLLAPTARPVRWSLAHPHRSASSVAALVMADDALAGRRDRAGVLAVLLRGADLDASPVLTKALAARASEPVVVATTEQRVATGTEHRPRAPLGLAYPAGRGWAADYPYVVLAAERSRRLAAADLLEGLHGDLGRRLLAASGFRDRFGVPGAYLVEQPGVDPAQRRPRTPRADEVSNAVRRALAMRRPSRLLSVLDVSGSMGEAVPAAGGRSRLDLAVRALVTGLATYQDDTVAGLWTFSTDLTRTADHRVMVPPVPLGTGPDGVSGRARLATALSSIRVTDGGTGLYDTVLASVRAARRGWDPDRVNSVILVTDGGNVDAAGISLPSLLRTLAAERDRSRPVAVFAVAYGPAADVGALRRIVRATGGSAYRALDYRDLPAVIAEAIGRRAATPRG